MFKIVAILATLAVAQADPLAFGYGAYAHGGAHGGAYGGAYGGAHVAAHAPVALGHQALGYAGHGFAGHGFAGHGFAGHGFAGHGFDGHGFAGHGFAGHGFGHHHEAHPFLSCYAKATSTGSISVNIKPRTYGYGLAGAGHAGLEATINVFNDGVAKDVIISFTEQSDALQSTGCSGAAYGDLIGPSSYEHDDDHSADHGFGHGFGFGYGYGHGYEAVAPSVASTTIGPDMMAAFHIDHIEGFTSMEQLAGRGVIVCLKDQAKKVDGHWVCNTNQADGTAITDAADLPISCCNLHYSAKGDTLQADGDRTPSV